MAKLSMRTQPSLGSRRTRRTKPIAQRGRVTPRGRGKKTFYRYRRSNIVPLQRACLLMLALGFAWWLGVSLRAEHRHAAAISPTHRYPPPQPTLVATPLPPTPPLTIDGAPSLNAQRVDGILAAYGSPLYGHGHDLVALSKRFDVDDAVAMAFFVMESRAGTQGEALLTHSFGNLRPLPNEPARDGYRSYSTWLESATEWYKVMRTLYLDTLKLHTIEDAIPVYAPATDGNDTASMIAGIHQLVRCWRGLPAACPDDPPGVRDLVAAAARR